MPTVERSVQDSQPVKPKISRRSRIRGSVESAKTHHMVEVRSREEVAEIMGLSKERIRQIEGIALWKLRHALKDEWEALTGRRPVLAA